MIQETALKKAGVPDERLELQRADTDLVAAKEYGATLLAGQSTRDPTGRSILPAATDPDIQSAVRSIVARGGSVPADFFERLDAYHGIPGTGSEGAHSGLNPPRLPPGKTSVPGVAIAAVPQQPGESDQAHQRRRQLGLMLAAGMLVRGGDELTTAQQGWSRLQQIAEKLGVGEAFLPLDSVLKDEAAAIPHPVGTPEQTAALTQIYQEYTKGVAHDLQTEVSNQLADLVIQRKAYQQAIDLQMAQFAGTLLDKNTGKLDFQYPPSGMND